jgi:hypothetical protein
MVYKPALRTFGVKKEETCSYGTPVSIEIYIRKKVGYQRFGGTVSLKFRV